jgi:hypothetical protein
MRYTTYREGIFVVLRSGPRHGAGKLIELQLKVIIYFQLNS